MKKLLVASALLLSLIAHAECIVNSAQMNNAQEAAERFKANDAKQGYWDSPEQRTQVQDFVNNLVNQAQKNCDKENAEQAKLQKDANDRAAEEAIRAKKPLPQIGWSAARILKSRVGAPDKINRTAGKGYMHEQWIYERYDLYIYVDNGVMTGFQQTE
jgi:hypothetical protein